MATLVRSEPAPRVTASLLLSSAVPAPFPREQLEQHQNQAVEPPIQEANVQSSIPTEDYHMETDNVQDSTAQGVLHEIMPSIAYVQKSCLMTLNNLLSGPTRWNPIVPDRRHSMPSSPNASTTTQADVESPSSALQTLLSNLRNRDDNNMVEVHPSASDSELFHELHTRVESLSSTLEPPDAHLSKALVALLSHINRLSVIKETSSNSINRSSNRSSWANPESTSSTDLFDTLKRQLSDLQLERISSQPEILAPGTSPVLMVEATLLWTRIDEELETVLAMCKERTESLSRPSLDNLPPQYDPADYHLDTPPEYESGPHFSIDDKSHHISHSPVIPTRQLDEKMRLDLEGVTMAIDRLYMVAPQLHNQRVELKSSKLEQMQMASQQGAHMSSKKQKARDIQELENIIDLLGKASERSIKDQSVILEGGLPGRMENAKLRDIARREAFVEQLAEHSNAGRLHDQDAVLQPRTKDPHTLLSLPEFIRESIPPGSRIEDPKAMLTLPEFVKEPLPIQIDDAEPELPDMLSVEPKKKSRHRSVSAPLSWLRPSSSRSVSSSNANGSNNTPPHSRSRSRAFNVMPPVPNVGFEVHYVAENHENLQHVLVFFTVTGATPGVDIEAEILPPFPESHAEGSDRLLIRSGLQSSLPLMLPACVLPGKQEVRVQSGHYEIKMITVSPPLSALTSREDPPPLLDASQLSSAHPTSFICASCSLPLVQSTRIEEYRDLPSEHWQELVDAWMCHSDQKLHEHVMKHGQGGFWPRPGQALVGGSYILFEEASITRNNLHIAEEPKQGEDWRLVRCICGAGVGRCQSYQAQDNLLVYRLLKYAIRPVSPTKEPSKIPLSAFIVEDMTEYIRAHATYRFVILDEEDELPRILIWLFKPSLRLAYTVPTPYLIPKSASIHAAKVLYRVLTPSEHYTDLKMILDKHPGFPQAEYLFYPMPICHRLSGLLRESNTAYPESVRTMTGLQVGWLHRA